MKALLTLIALVTLISCGPMYKPCTVRVVYTDGTKEIYQTGLWHSAKRPVVFEMCTHNLRENRCGVRSVEIINP